MAEINNDKTTNPNTGSITKIINESKKRLDKMSKGIIGYGRDMEKIIDPSIDNINFDNFSVNNVRSVQDNLFNIRGNDKKSKYKVNEAIYGAIASIQDESMITEVLEGRIKLNNEFNYLLNNMTELSTSLEALADDVVYPNISSKSGITIEISGNDNKDDDARDELLKYFRPNQNISATINSERLYNFDIDAEVKNTVFDIGVYGYQIVATIPYSSIVTDILYDQEVRKSRNESVEIINSRITDYKSFAENVNSFFEEKHLLNKERLKKKVNELGISNISAFKERAGDMFDIIHGTPYTREDVDYVLEQISSNSESMFVASGTTDSYTTDSSIKGIQDLLGTKENDVNGLSLYSSGALEELRAKRNKKFVVDNIVGCTYDVLDNTKTVPVFIKGQLLGCYVLTDESDLKRIHLGKTLTNLLGTNTLIDHRDNYKGRLRDLILNDVETILRNNVDKKFVRNNPNLIEDLEYILINRNAGADGVADQNFLRGSVRFIPAEYLTLHKLGKGDLGTPLMAKSRVYAKMYIQMLKMEHLSKAFLEKPRFEVGVTHTGDLSAKTEITKAMLTYRNSIPRMTDVGVPDVMTDSIASAYQSVLIPKNINGDKLLDIQQMPVFQGNDNGDYMRQLRNAATLPLGYPADLLDPSQQVDFAKKISNINIHVLIKVLSIQKSLEISLSKMCTKRLRYMTGNNKLEVIIKFEIPRELTDNITTETIGKIRELIEIYSEFIDNDPEIKDEHKDQFKVKVGKKLFTGVLDTDEIDGMYKEFKVDGK